VVLGLDKSRFLITGLPRTRTTWLTVLFNCLGVNARHERDLHFDSMEHLVDWLGKGTEKSPNGLIDGFASIAYPSFALKIVEDNPIVFVKRPVSEVIESWHKWQGHNGHDSMIENAMKNYYHFIAEMPEQTLVVEYKDLDKYETVNEIVNYCTNKTIEKELFHFLNHTKIELHGPKCTEFTKNNPKAYLQHIE
jgi:hypothetical protein